MISPSRGQRCVRPAGQGGGGGGGSVCGFRFFFFEAGRREDWRKRKKRGRGRRVVVGLSCQAASVKSFPSLQRAWAPRTHLRYGREIRRHSHSPGSSQSQPVPIPHPTSFLITSPKNPIPSSAGAARRKSPKQTEREIHPSPRLSESRFRGEQRWPPSPPPPATTPRSPPTTTPPR